MNLQSVQTLGSITHRPAALQRVEHPDPDPVRPRLHQRHVLPTLVASATYTWNPSTGNTVTIPLPSGTSDQYVELSFTANNVQNGAQASEIEIFG